MAITLTFQGAAGNVTGSRTVVDNGNARICIDCGMFQEWKLKERNWQAFDGEPTDFDAVLLTHAHLDHCGLLPRLCKLGFNGAVFGTRPTLKIARIIMEDSAHIQEEDAKYKNKRHEREDRDPETIPHPVEALYDSEDAELVPPLFQGVDILKPVEVAPGITATWFPAGHILGACSILLEVTDGTDTRTILFSGDLGRWDAPLLEDPTCFEQADYVVLESTYGDRRHEDNHDIPAKLAQAINDAVRRGGNILIPSFAVERSQDLLYYLANLRHNRKIPPLLTFVDSPMAIKVTEVFKEHRNWFDQEAKDHLEQGRTLMDFQGLMLTRTVDESKGINQIRGSCIIIAGSGMCTGGRIKHHLKRHIDHPEHTILFIGYQANGTLGRQILEKKPEVRIHGQMFPVNCHVERINGFSGHADQEELLRWLGSLTSAPRKVFLNHGESQAAAALSQEILSRYDYRVDVPQYRETVTLA